MVMSMTGYGSDSFHLEDTTITVEIKSVNSRYLDFIPKIPRPIQDIELEINNIGVIEMVMSMTGYGSDSFNLEDTTITVEIKSVNSRYLDFIPKIPRTLQELEIEIKHLIQDYFQRGRIELYITIVGDYLTNKTLTVDWNLIDQYLAKMKEVKKRYHLDDDISLSSIIGKDELFTVQETKIAADSFKSRLLESIEQAAKQVLEN